MSAPRPGFIHPTAVIGSPPEHRGWKDGDSVFEPLIHETAQVNAYVTVDAGLEGETRIGSGAFLMAHTHVGHDAVIGSDCELAPGTVIGGHAHLEDGVRCGIGALVLPFKRIGKGARIGAGAVVTKDVPAGEIWVGNPARCIRHSGTGEMWTGEQWTRLEEEGWDSFGQKADHQAMVAAFRQEFNR